MSQIAPVALADSGRGIRRGRVVAMRHPDAGAADGLRVPTPDAGVVQIGQARGTNEMDAAGIQLGRWHMRSSFTHMVESQPI
jgi:hypothetical protein